jgi:hypothetical protein
VQVLFQETRGKRGTAKSRYSRWLLVLPSAAEKWTHVLPVDRLDICPRGDMATDGTTLVGGEGFYGADGAVGVIVGIARIRGG